MEVRRLMCVAAVVGSAVSARADLTDPAFSIFATNAFGFGELAISNTAGQWVNGVWHWESTEPLSIPNVVAGGTLAMLDTLVLTYYEDPLISLNFSVTAGGVPTHFIISSALLSFPGISGAVGNATAAVTVTDLDQIGGATLTGVHPGGNAYLSQFNGFVPTGTDFTSLVVGPIVAPLGGSTVASAFTAPTAIGPSVGDMSSRWDFILSAGDSASGTSTYQIVPSPASGALLCMGLLAMRRRR